MMSDTRARSALPVLMATASLTLMLISVLLTGTVCGAILALLSGGFLLLALQRQLNQPYVSPTWLTAGMLLVIAALSGVLGDRLNGIQGGGVVLSISDDLRVRTLELFGRSAFWLLVGVAIVMYVGKSRPGGARGGTLKFTPPTGKLAAGLAAVAVLPLLMILSYLGTDVIERSSYLAGSGGTNLFGLGQSLALGSVAICGYFYGRGRGGGKFIALAGIATYGCLFFSLGSRRLALVPVLVLVGVGIGQLGRKKLSRLFLIVAVAASLVLLPLPLYLRGLDEHGFVPYIASLPGFSLTGVDWLSTLNNVLVSFPITAQSAFVVQPLPTSLLATELNPLPGSLTGFYDVSQTLTINTWTPYSAVGELGNHGGLVMAAVWIFLGVVVGYLERRVRHYVVGGLGFVAVVLTGLTGLFAVQMIQYSLRPSFRMLVYAVLLDIAYRVWSGGKGASYPDIPERGEQQVPADVV